MAPRFTWIGVDFGGTSLRAALVDLETGVLSASMRIPTPAMDGPRAVIDAISRLIARVIEQTGVSRRSIAAAGVGCPARVDLSRGILMVVPNVPGDWPAIPFKDELQERTGINVFPINDVRSITLGEYTFGAGRGVDNLACYAVGTGIGGGVIINGNLHLGISGSAGELGHQVVDPYGAMCNCGGRGCLETIASGPALVAQALEAIARRVPSRISLLVSNDMNLVSPSVIIEAARQGDRVANAILDRAGTYLGIAITNTLVTISPRRILIGGGVAAAGDLLLEPIRRTVRERTFMVPVDDVEIMPASLGDQAGLLGAALWARSQSNLSS
jgi:glucokinase